MKSTGFYCLLVFYCIVLILFTANYSLVYANSGENTYWQCETLDKEHNSWIARSYYHKVAINLAYSDCKKNSKYPLSCATSKSSCDHIVNGASTSPLWHCTSYDTFAQPWKSNYYRERDDAAMAAKAYCKENSKIPDTCYTNFVTCENVNEGAMENGIFSGINW